jgi:Bacterial regulatory helix-turn-helix proteins, AraC family
VPTVSRCDRVRIGTSVARYPDPLAWTTAEANTQRVDAHTVGDVPGLHVEKTRSWGLVSADIISRAAGETNWLSDSHRVTVAQTEMNGIVHIDGGPARPVRNRPGLMSFLPAGISVRNILPAGRIIQIRQRPETYDTIISEIVRGGSVHLEQLLPIAVVPRQDDDPLVLQIASAIAQEIENGYLNRILVDALNTALAVRIVRRFADPSKLTPAPSNGLSRERLQRVYEYVEAHLDDRLSLGDLAGVACLSPYHFSRSFTQAVGVGPQRYVMQRRIEKAKILMRRSN